MNEINSSVNENLKRLTHLVVLLDTTAPSVCYYETAKSSKKQQIMSLDVLKQVVEFAKANNVFINLIYGLHDIPTEMKDLIESTEHAKIIPLLRWKEMPDGVPVLQYSSKGIDYSLFPSEEIQNIIIRVPKSNLRQFSDEVPILASKVKRINLILDKLDRFTEKDLVGYKKSLLKISDTIRQTCKEGAPMEFNSITDRIALDTMRNCDAGVTNLTVAPNGNWYICPGFFYSDSPDLGNLNDGVTIKNQKLYELQYAPICKECDCYHCKRCVYLNHSMTLEVNTPSHIQCIVSHKEREISRVLLRQLQSSKMLLNINPIPALGYDDPFDIITGKKKRLQEYDDYNYEEDTMAVSENENKIENEKKGEYCETFSNQKLILVGEVTKEEKDEIKHLFERKTSLEELIQSLMKFSQNDLQENALYDRLIDDFTRVRSEFEKWWENKADSYRWQKGKKGQFIINFDTCQVFNADLD